MLKKEAKWLGRAIYSIPAGEVFPMLNVGSSTRYFREVKQPWLYEYILKPAGDHKHSILHTDLKAEPGVDLVGDFIDPAFLTKLSGLSIRSILCANVLEHLAEPAQFCGAMTSLLPAGGLIFLSVPHVYPYHSDPIDTRFRPDVPELAGLFPKCEIVRGQIVDCGRYISQERNPPFLFALQLLVRLLLPFYRPSRWYSASIGKLFWLFKNVSVTCAVLRKRT